MSDELPPGWALTDIGSLGRYINGRGFGKAEWKKAGLPIIRIQNLNDESAPFNYSDQQHEEKYRVDDDDLLVAWAASLGVYVWKRGPAWLNQHIFRVEVEERAVTKPFLYYALKDALAGLYKKAHGSGMVHITKAKFDRHPVNLPPLNEQKRIVSKIDELFSRIEEGERALERVSKLLERYRQSVLKAAVTGELTRDWREQRKAAGEPIESGESLLTRILAARREAWEQAELAKLQTKGITPKDDAWKQKYKHPAAPDTTDLPELPSEWVWASIEQLVYDGPTNGYSPKSDSGAMGTQSLKLTATTSGVLRLDSDATKRIHDVIADDSPYWLAPGDLLIQRANSLEHVGVAAIYDGPTNSYIYPDLMMRLRVHDENVRRLIWRYINSSGAKSYFQANATGTAGSMPKINGEVVRRLAIPLPGKGELSVALSRLEREIGSVGVQTKETADQLRRVAALKQSVLRSAFSGSIVASDPKDEPASLVLERIAAEPAKSNATAPQRGRKKKSI